MTRSPWNGYVNEVDAASVDLSSRADSAAPAAEPHFALLLALTDDQRAPAASAVAQALEREKNATPYAVYVIEVGVSIPEAAMVAVTLETALREPRTRVVQEAKMRAVLGLDVAERAAWPFSIEVGNVAAVVTGEAASRGAELIVMGLNRHAAIGRAMGRDTVRQVTALSSIPVLAVRDLPTGLPTRVVVAMDFSSSSIRAARTARRLIGDGGELHMIYVEPGAPVDASAEAEGQRLIQREGVCAVFAQLCDELSVDGLVTVSSTVVVGADPPAEILRYCEAVRPDVVALGSQQRGLLGRLGMGGTGGAVAADGRWSVLVSPPSPDRRP